MTDPRMVAPGGLASSRLFRFDALGSAEIDAWHELRAANTMLDSPYFHPGFADAVHASGLDVTVAVGRDAQDRVCALLPAHQERSLLRPLGWPGADFQGPIVAADTPLDPMALLPAGVASLSFDHLLPYPGFDPWVQSRQASPFLDTSGGLTGYLGRASRSGKDNMGQARRRTAKAERTHGLLRFAADIVDHEALAHVIALKRAQYAATGARDYFADQRRVGLMTRLLDTRGTDFAGILSTVHVGPRLLAAHFGIRSGSVLHWWFPVYDPEFASLAPGWILLRELVAATPQLGITRIDLGRGDDEYKRRAKTGEVMVGRGLVTRNRTRRLLYLASTSMIAAAKSSPLGPGLRQVARRLRNR